MSLYYKQEFVPSSALKAEVKEMLKSYFNAGIIDDLLFSTWVSHCLKRFRKSALKIENEVLKVCDYKMCLPEGFKGVREAWMCTCYWADGIQDPSSYYYQKDCVIDIPTSSCDQCGSQSGCDCTYLVTHKVQGTLLFSFKRSFLLRPGNMQTRNHCEQNTCFNTHSSTPYTFDIQDGNLITNFESGDIYLVYYADPNTGEDEMVPDNFFVQEYIRNFLIYKCYEQLSHLVTVEEYNQIERKKMDYDQKQATAFIIAETDLKKQTSEEKVRLIGVSYRRFNKFRIP